MKSLLPISLIFAALALTSASPVNFKRASLNEGPIAIPLKRNNIGAPDNESTLKALDVDSIPLNGQIDQFSVTVSIGTPPTNYELIIDTGSKDTWVISADCASTACQNRTLYNSTNSSTVEREYWTFASAFGDGDTVSGDVYTDTVTIFNATVARQGFGAATSLLTPNSVIRGDGVLGLPATDESNPSFFDSFFDNAFERGSLSKYIFSLYMPSVGAGELLLGDYNLTLFTGNLTYLPIGPTKLWQVTIDDLAYRNRFLSISLTATIDTATSLIQLDRQSANVLYATIPGANRLSPTRWSIPCGQVSNFTITMGGVAFNIPGSSISQGPLSPGSNQCVSAITGGQRKGHATLGMAFLENYYTVFDKSASPFRIGFGAIH
ncbi:hypothetical protein BGX28_006524 [Mortierella sp. GBA30]|nr:hypothetical protein BGX28_006524 [Mortierella sp. GBA30]